MPVVAFDAAMRHHEEQQKRALLGPAMVCLTLTNIHRKRRAPYRMEEVFPELAGKRRGASSPKQMRMLGKMLAAATKHMAPPQNVAVMPWGRAQ